MGSSCGQHGPYTFYKAIKIITDNKERILTLGEFFFLKILGEGGPICAGELQLIWENNQEQQYLSSLRLYFLPEHTPDGRQYFHGEVIKNSSIFLNLIYFDILFIVIRL